MANTELIEFLPDTCSPQSVPHTYGCIGTRGQDRIPNTYGFDLPTDFGTTNATDTYLHAIDDNVGGITYTYPPATGNPTTPIVATNVAAIQSFLTSIGSGITYTVNAFNEIVLTYATPGDENRWSFWMGTSNPDGYTNKLLPTLHDLRVDTVTYQEVQIIKQQNNDGTYVDKFFLPSGNSTLTEVALAADQTFKFGTCPTNDCGDFTSNCMCYGSDTNASDYVYALEPNQGTEGSFGMNSDTLKWETSGNLSSSIPFIDDCISGGGEATITITDQNGNIVIFTANGFLTAPGSTPFAAYSGVGPGGFSGKIRAVTISCSTSAAGKGKACQWISCDKLTTKWFDGTYELTQEEIDTLAECTIPVSIEPECEVNLVQVQGCASEATAEVTIGDLILTIAKQDCNNVILSSQQFNVSQSNLLLTIPVQTESCNPQPSITQTEECILDAKKQKWTEITIVQGVNTTVIYVNQDTLEIGVPIGLPNEWTSCDVECSLTPDCCFCFCAMTLPIVRAAVKKEALAKETKAVATTKPVKVNICITNWRDCTQTVVKRTYTIDGVDVPEATFLKLKYTKTVCADPIPTFTPGTPTCGTYVDPFYGVVVLNVTIFTNDANPTDTFTIYNLADNYTGLGNIGDVYLPADENLVVACNCSPLPECITTTEECYKALVDVKGVANTGDTITVKVTNNAVTNTDYYEITHSTTNSLIYAGTDPVTDIGLDVNDILVWELSPCDPPAPEVFDILEKEVCGTIDGSTDTYELVRVYTRNPTTGIPTTLFYEDNFGNQITGVVVEVCCTCDTLCTVAPALPLLSNVTAYARSLTGQNGCGDKFVIGADIQWQVKIYQNGTLILNSATSPILTSQAAAFTWLDSNAGGYWLNTTTLPWAFANNINTYQFVSPTDPDEYLMVLTETGNGASYCGGNLTSYRWAFTNKGVSLGLSCDNADAFAWSDLWADRTGWDWKC